MNQDEKEFINKSVDYFLEGIMKLKKIILVILCVMLGSCTNPYEAKKAVAAMGFTDIQSGE